MTAPHIQVPDGTPQFPDVEKALITVIGEFATELTPQGHACNVPPENMAEMINNGNAVITVQRVGGGAERTLDRTRVFITVATAYRADSNNIMSWLREKLRNYCDVVHNPDGTTAIISEITDMTGPEKAIPLGEDYRVVRAGFNVTTRLER